jgi:hypothetical protein
LFKYNIFKFGDVLIQQTEGIPMGSRPSPPLATIYYGIREEAVLLQDFTTNLLDYARFIDDGIGLWDTAAGPNPTRAWERFTTAVNAWGSLTWIVSPLTLQVDFLDVTFSLRDGEMNYSLFCKELNLYLYLPPHSAHPPGVLKGMIYGMFFRFYKLIKNVHDKNRHLAHFLNRLVTRGYSPSFLGPIFADARDYVENRRQLLIRPTIAEKNRLSRERVFLHLPFHPRDPRSRQIQKLFRSTVLSPPGEPPLWELPNHLDIPSNIRRLIVCYHRPKNLENLLCPRRLPEVPGSTVSGILCAIRTRRAGILAALPDPQDPPPDDQDHAVDPAGAQNPGFARLPSSPSDSSSSAASQASRIPRHFLSIPSDTEQVPCAVYAPMRAATLDPLYSDSSE